MQNKLVLAVVALTCTPLESTANNRAQPSERIAQFVVDTLDLTSLPAAFRLKKAKGKKTFADYGFVAQSLGETDVILTPTPRTSPLQTTVIPSVASTLF